MCSLEYVNRWTSVMGEVEACIFFNHLFPELVTRTWTNLMEGGQLILTDIGHSIYSLKNTKFLFLDTWPEYNVKECSFIQLQD